MECISYKDGYKYQLKESSETIINIRPDNDITTDYIDLSSEGKLVIKKVMPGIDHPDQLLTHSIL